MRIVELACWGDKKDMPLIVKQHLCAIYIYQGQYLLSSVVFYFFAMDGKILKVRTVIMLQLRLAFCLRCCIPATNP